MDDNRKIENFSKVVAKYCKEESSGRMLCRKQNAFPKKMEQRLNK